MKRLACVLLSAVFMLGALALCAGCGSEVTDEAKKKEILAAFDKAEISMFEMTVEVSAMASSKRDDGFSITKSTARSDVVAYEENGRLYGDMYMDVSADAISGDDDYSQSETSKVYTVAFARGDIAYTDSGEWADCNVKEGDFDALIENYRGTADPLSSADISALFDLESLGQGDVEAYVELATGIDGKVIKTNGGYRIEYDFVDGYRQLIRKLESAMPYYAEHPDITVSELFEVAGMAGAEKIYFFYDDTDYTSAPASYWGSPEELAEYLKSAEEDTGRELARNMFSLSYLGEEDKASLTIKVTAELDGELRFKSLSMLFQSSVELSNETGETWSDSKTELSMQVKALSQTPALRTLTGLKAELYRPAVGTFGLGNETSASLYLPVGGDRIDGKLTGKAVVQEDGPAVVTLTFTGDHGPAVTETWTVDLMAISVGERVSHTFFTEYMGETYRGLSEEIASEFDSYEIKTNGFFTKIIKLPTAVTL